uniref:Carrier domain-containing protein n=1 Tax=Alexandrium monilatum TaxID=311494 RepID=A0A7S4QZB5_9DINO
MASRADLDMAQDKYLPTPDRRIPEDARIEDPLHNRCDDLAPGYSMLADDSSAEMKKREAAMLFTAAEGYLNDEDTSEGLKAAMEALPLFRELNDLNAVHDTLRVIINLHRLESGIAYDDAPTEAERIAREELPKFQQFDDKRGQAAMLLSLAECQCDRRRVKPSEYESAETLAQDSLAFFREVGDTKMTATALLELAHICVGKKEPDEVYESSKEACDLFKQIGDKKGEARALHGIAVSYVLKRQFSDAIPRMKDVLAMFRDMGVKKFEAFELCLLAEAHLEEEKPLKALPLARQALTIFREIRYGKGWEAASLLAVTHSLVESKKARQAAQVAEDGLKRLKAQGDQRQIAFGYFILIDAQVAAEMVDEALESAESCMDVVKDLGDRRLEVDTLHMTMWCYHEKKDWPKALEQMDECLSLVQELDDEDAEAACMRNISYLQHRKDSHQTGAEKGEEARSIYEKVEDKSGEAGALMIVSGCVLCQGDADEAIEKALQAQDLFKEAKDPLGEANACAMLADLYLDTETQYDSALESAQKAVDLMREFASPKNELRFLRVLAGVYEKGQDYEAAEEAMSSAKKIAVGMQDMKAECQCLLQLVQIYMAMNGEGSVFEGNKLTPAMEKAMKSSSEAVNLSPKTHDRDLLASTRYNRALLLSAAGRLEDAKRLAEEAMRFYVKSEDASGEAKCLILQGNVVDGMHQTEEGKALIYKGMELAQSIGDDATYADGQTLLDKMEARDRIPIAVAPVQEMIYQQGGAAPAAGGEGGEVVSAAKAAPKGLDPTMVRNKLMVMVKDVMASDDELEVDSPFMEAGMDSLSSVSLMSQVAKEFQMSLSPSLVFDFPTVRALQDHLIEESKSMADAY